MTGYPRDLVGYADQLPDPRWPGGARLALNFVVNYEEGGERSVLHGDKVAETRLTDILMPVPLQGARDLNMESAYEYGSRVGFWRLMRVFAERQVVPTIYAVGMALERNPHAAETMARQGCDVVDHGWRWLDYHGIDEATEREHIRLSVETIRRLTGARPIGWYIGTPSANTRRLVVEEGGFLYDSNAYNDELPYWTYDYGRPHLIIPHTLDDNDTRLGRGLGWGQAEDFFVSLQAGARRRVCPFRRSRPAPRRGLDLPAQRNRRALAAPAPGDRKERMSEPAICRPLRMAGSRRADQALDRHG